MRTKSYDQYVRSYSSEAPNRTTLSLPADLVRECRNLDLNISAVCRDALTETVAAIKEKQTA